MKGLTKEEKPEENMQEMVDREINYKIWIVVICFFTAFLVFLAIPLLVSKEFPPLLILLLLLPVPCAFFVHVDARKHKMSSSWLWVVGAFFLTIFVLPFYILRRPREEFFYCPDCGIRNLFPVDRCQNCSLEIDSEGISPVRREWRLSDAIAIFAISSFVLPMLLMFLLTRLLGQWVLLVVLSAMGITLVGLSLWFILKMCRRPLSDIGITRQHLCKNIILGIVLVVPVFLMINAAEDLVVRGSIMIIPSQIEHIQSMREKESSRVVNMFQGPNELLRFIVAVFLIVILWPVGEEMLFRGIAYNALRRRGKWRALIISSLIFAIAHFQVIHLIPNVLAGFAFAYLFERTRSLTSVVVLHASLNLVSVLLARTGL